MKTNWMIPGCAFAALALTAVACYTPPEDGSPSFVKSVRVDSSRGAVITVTSDESPELAGTVLTIGPGALPADTTITLELGLDSIVGGQSTPAGPVAIFGPPGTVFSTPARLTLPVALSNPQKESDLFIQVVEDNGDRTEIPRELLEVASGTVSFRVNGFTSFQPGTNANQQQDAGQHDAGSSADAGGTACNSHAQCQSHELCINGTCHLCTGGACSGMCTNNSHCATGRVCVGGQCVQFFDGGTPSDGGTPQSCDPLQQNCNAVGHYCYFDSSAQAPHAFCAANTATQGAGQSCNHATDCLDMSLGRVWPMHCAGLSVLSPGVCREYCDTTAAAGCPNPAQTCTAISGAPAGLGYCQP